MKGQMPYYRSEGGDFTLHLGDARQVVPQLGERFDMVFADPPYFLSNGGFSVQSGKRVSVNKGDWDKSQGRDSNRRFTAEWLAVCKGVMKPSATIWVCGTFHNIFTIAEVMSEQGFKILNSIVWQKTNPPPNLSCRYFTHSTEIIIWARKEAKTAHMFNYDLMRRVAGNRQMTDVWRMPAIARWEKSCGKHPTQKPLALVARAIMSCTSEDAQILDPFAGSGTTGIAANLLSRKFIGIDTNKEYLGIAEDRRLLLDRMRVEWLSRLSDFKALSH